MQRLLFHTCTLSALLLAHVQVCGAEQSAPSLADYSLEQLSEIVVTSVSRQETRLGAAPASIYVISGADIQRSGAATLPEALRLAPNLQVARANAHSYAISARGFSSTLANKLLVLIDGRSVYSPLFSGVFWDMQDVVMSDIERIEVISGPGATIWGANAVNGVINVITKSARDTQGGRAMARGSEHGRSASVRYGGRLENGVWYRVYGQGIELGDTENEGRDIRGSGWHRTQTGFRFDWDGEGKVASIGGDAYTGRLADSPGPIVIAGANLNASFTRTLQDGSDMRLQAYLDQFQRDQAGVAVQHLYTFDVEAQFGGRIGSRHRLAWGGGYRHSTDRISNGPALQFIPATRNLRWANLFAQDEIALSDTLRATAGVKFEHNIYTGVEALPSVRLAWAPDSARLLWAAASRTVRAPSRIDRDMYIANHGELPGVGPYLIVANPNFVSETANVLELGYRAQKGTLSYSATAFYSKYARLRTLELPPGQPALFGNLGRGVARGVELWAGWQPLPSWRLSGGGVIQRVDTGAEPGSMDVSGLVGLAPGNDPRRYWSLRSSHDLAHNLQADFSLRYVGSLPQPQVPAYHELDARVAWQVRPNLELAVAGGNLLHHAHAEFGPQGARQLFERFVMFSATLRF
ncbi:TonB-dependent receptor plug domain-containing protein [Massilia horti]|nr:TonB-dependent receptor [Massilia horti]